jgi:hypothetical protein
MRYKTNWEETRRRLTALWNGEAPDRPCIAVMAPSGRAVPAPDAPDQPWRRWLDPEWVPADVRARMENTLWGGEALPSYLLMGGWVMCLGGTPRFERETIWFETGEVDFSRPFSFRYGDPENGWVGAFEDLYRAVAAMAGGQDFMVGHPCMLPANDLLSMCMGTERFLIALMEHPQWMREAIVTGAREQLRIQRRLQDSIRDEHDFWYGNAGWMPFWAPRPYASTQSDVSCMLSPEMFEEFIVPELDVYGEEFGAMWYHLDGGDARQHLPRLLSLPYMRVIQYVPRPSEPPNGPEHLDLYREIQRAGCIVHVSVPRENVEPLVRELDPALTMLQTRCESVEEGEDLLEAARSV